MNFVGPYAYDNWRAACAAAGKATLDVILLTHPRDEHDIPRLFPSCKRLTVDERRELTRHLRPLFGEIMETPVMNVGILFLPVCASEMMSSYERKRSRQLLMEGLDAAAEAGPGAQVCLGGLTGTLSGYGRRIEDRAAELGLRLTTGHSLTALSILDTYLRALRDLSLNPASRAMALLGTGSVGGAFAKLLLSQEQLPAKLVLIDRPARCEHVERLAQELRASNKVEITVETTSASGRVETDSACYHADFLITAVSTPYLIDIDQVASGAVLVDDSQPYCWSREQAWRRCTTDHDIAPCEAGLVDVHSMGYRSQFPFDFADHGPAGSQTSWSCLAEGLLRRLRPDLPPTLGEPTLEVLLQYEVAFRNCGFCTPSLQCGSNILPVSTLTDRFHSLASCQA